MSIARSTVWFPFVGAMVGSVGALIGWVTSSTWSAALVSCLAVIAMYLITGAFHLDGLADMADAFGGGWTVEQRMEILKDSRLGTYGTTALVLALLTEVVATADLISAGGPAIFVLIGCHAMSRGMAVAVMRFAPTAGDGLGASYARELSLARTLAAVLSALLIGAVTFSFAEPDMAVGAAVAIVAAAMVAVSAMVVLLSQIKIGGITGDVLGAIQVLSYVTGLLTIAAFL